MLTDCCRVDQVAFFREKGGDMNDYFRWKLVDGHEEIPQSSRLPQHLRNLEKVSSICAKSSVRDLILLVWCLVRTVLCVAVLTIRL